MPKFTQIRSLRELQRHNAAQLITLKLRISDSEGIQHLSQVGNAVENQAEI